MCQQQHSISHRQASSSGSFQLSSHHLHYPMIPSSRPHCNNRIFICIFTKIPIARIRKCFPIVFFALWQGITRYPVIFLKEFSYFCLNHEQIPLKLLIKEHEIYQFYLLFIIGANFYNTYSIFYLISTIYKTFISQGSGSFALIFYFYKKGIISFNIFKVRSLPIKCDCIDCEISFYRDSCTYFNQILMRYASSPLSQLHRSLGFTYLAFNFDKISLISMFRLNFINYFQIIESMAQQESQIIKFSHRALIFNKDKPFTLGITNISDRLSVIFKIKTTKLNTYEVKPPLGSIQPGQKKNIEFKLIKPLTQQEMIEARGKDKFQFQFLTVEQNKVPKVKAEYKALWDDAKSDPQKELNIAHFTLPIQDQNQINLLATVNSQPFSPLKVKNSISKLDNSKSAALRKTLTLQSNPKKDEQLSKQFQKLKQKQDRLLEQREKVFKSQVKTPGNQSKGSGMQIALRKNEIYIIVIVVFLFSVMVGNFFKLRVFVGEEL